MWPTDPFLKSTSACLCLLDVQDITIMCLAHYAYVCQDLLIKGMSSVPPPPVRPAFMGPQVPAKQLLHHSLAHADLLVHVCSRACTMCM